jgi:gas vesicle protein
MKANQKKIGEEMKANQEKIGEEMKANQEKIGEELKAIRTVIDDNKRDADSKLERAMEVINDKFSNITDGFKTQQPDIN